MATAPTSIITTTTTEFLTTTHPITTTITRTLASAAASSTSLRAAEQGILQGGNPSVFDKSNPIILFIIQAGIIIFFCRLLHWPLSWLRQPRVIAEVIGGILLGPSVMGRVPGFTDAIFPTASMPPLSLVANMGLVLFLFLVGLEVDLRFFVRNWRAAVSVGAAGMAIPFGLGCAIAWGLYNEFRDEPGTTPIAFGTYMLFIGVAMAITAFPVLCRILTELQLLSTPVGVIVISAGVGNDVLGWVLLALCVALVNASSGITALWVLLTCIAWVLFLAFAVRPAFMHLLRRTHALQDGPSQSIIALTLLIALTSAFFTGAIGVHPIFGAFLAGLICPHEGGFAIKVTEKVEDLVGALFLPLYFALSGLSTNLGLLDTGIAWAYVVGIIVVAFCGKFLGGTIAARLNGLVWRESCTIGVLMSCKGLVELIVLNIGLQARILSQRTFTMFVVMALVTTFATTPLTQALYPPWYQRKLETWKRGEIDWNTGEPTQPDGLADGPENKEVVREMRSLLVYLRLESMPAMLSLVSLLGRKPQELSPSTHPSLIKKDLTEKPHLTTSTQEIPHRPVQVHGMRLIELTDRTSAVMKVSEIDAYALLDPILSAFRMLGRLFNLSVSGEVAVVPENSYANTLVARAAEESADLLLLPWSETGSLSENTTLALAENAGPRRNTLDPHAAYPAFVAEIMNSAPCTTAVFVNHHAASFTPRPPLRHMSSGLSIHAQRREISTSNNNPDAFNDDPPQHIFMPFFGFGPDDAAALRLVLQFAENPAVTATVVYFRPTPSPPASQSSPPSVPARTLLRRQTSSAVSTGSGHDADDLDSSPTFPLPLPSPSPAPRALNDDTNPCTLSSFFTNLQTSLPPHLKTRVLLTEYPLPSSSSSSSPPQSQPHTPLLDAALIRAAAEFPSKPLHHNASESARTGMIVLGRNAGFASPLAANRESASHAENGLGLVAEMFFAARVVQRLVVVSAANSAKGEGGR